MYNVKINAMRKFFKMCVFILFASYAYSQTFTCTQVYQSVGDAYVWFLNNQNSSWGPTNVTNYSNRECLDAQVWTWSGSWGIRRSYINFDLSSAMSLSNTSITNASLFLFNPLTQSYYSDLYLSSVTNQIAFHRVTSSWSETSVTWNNQPNFDVSTEVLAGPIPSTSNTPVYSDLTVEISSIILGSGEILSDFNGISFNCVGENTDPNKYRRMVFASRDYIDSDFWPAIELEFEFPEPEIYFDGHNSFSVENISDLENIYDNIVYEWNIEGETYYGNSIQHDLSKFWCDHDVSLTVTITNNWGQTCTRFIQEVVHGDYEMTLPQYYYPYNNDYSKCSGLPSNLINLVDINADPREYYVNSENTINGHHYAGFSWSIGYNSPSVCSDYWDYYDNSVEVNCPDDLKYVAVYYIDREACCLMKTSTDQLKNSGFISLSPNPIDSYTVLLIDDLPCEKCQYSIVNNYGKTITSGVTEKDGQIHVSDLKNGKYIIIVKSKDYDADSSIHFVKQ